MNFPHNIPPQHKKRTYKLKWNESQCTNTEAFNKVSNRTESDTVLTLGKLLEKIVYDENKNFRFLHTGKSLIAVTSKAVDDGSNYQTVNDLRTDLERYLCGVIFTLVP